MQLLLHQILSSLATAAATVMILMQIAVQLLSMPSLWLRTVSGCQVLQTVPLLDLYSICVNFCFDTVAGVNHDFALVKARLRFMCTGMVCKMLS